MLIDQQMAETFLTHYKAVMTYLNDGVDPDGVHAYASLRQLIFERIEQIEDDVNVLVGQDFVSSLKSGHVGTFVYLKKYQKGYVLQEMDSGQYYQVSALTTPLEELVGEFSVIDTAIIPYASTLVCDGLVLSHGISIGKNTAKEIRDGYWAAKRAGELIINA